MNEFNDTYGFSEVDWTACLKVLEQLKDDPFNNPENEEFGTLITKLYKGAKKQRKSAVNDPKKAADQEALMKSEIAKRALENTSLFSDKTPETQHYTQLNTAKNCYACNERFDKIHSFYHRLCPSCAEKNYERRFETVDLNDRKVLITGGRVKIGYAAALKFLRCRAQVTVTTRFPALALEQFQKEEDYNEWGYRLVIFGLDLRNLHAVNAFTEYYKSAHGTLDIFIQNAAQTIKYTETYYAPLIKKETALLPEANEPDFFANETPVVDASLLLESFQEDFDKAPLTRFGQPVDQREKNSWNSKLEEISTPELLEVNLINHISPYILLKALTPNMEASSFKQRFVINVTSSEGQFSYSNKTMFHPHTNMTKAALNMLTRTAAMEYEQKGIFMTSVDVGWVSTGVSEKRRQEQFNRGMIPPLDSVDGAARILHPIIEGLVHKNLFSGVLLKNYTITEW
jgi:NAD(P)-dependent dehydrogenase (short-subunit alcohol dehydrogenase family)